MTSVFLWVFLESRRLDKKEEDNPLDNKEQDVAHKVDDEWDQKLLEQFTPDNAQPIDQNDGFKGHDEIHINDYDIKQNNIDHLLFGHPESNPSDGARMAQRHIYNGMQTKQSIINASRKTVNTYKHLYEPELQEAENRQWWDNDKLDGFMRGLTDKM